MSPGLRIDMTEVFFEMNLSRASSSDDDRLSRTVIILPLSIEAVFAGVCTINTGSPLIDVGID